MDHDGVKSAAMFTNPSVENERGIPLGALSVINARCLSSLLSLSVETCKLKSKKRCRQPKRKQK